MGILIEKFGVLIATKIFGYLEKDIKLVSEWINSKAFSNICVNLKELCDNSSNRNISRQHIGWGNYRDIFSCADKIYDIITFDLKIDSLENMVSKSDHIIIIRLHVKLSSFKDYLNKFEKHHTGFGNYRMNISYYYLKDIYKRAFECLELITKIKMQIKDLNKEFQTNKNNFALQSYFASLTISNADYISNSQHLNRRKFVHPMGTQTKLSHRQIYHI